MLKHAIVLGGALLFAGPSLAEEPAAAHDKASAAQAPAEAASAKPASTEILKQLSDGNARFREGKTLGPHRDLDRVKLAAGSDQANYALATVLSCADSRVPVELLFDTGVMDLFVVRVAGNVADTDEVGTIEYGLAHVNTPVLIVMGHSGCGAVKAVAQAVAGHGHPLEKNIPPLVDNIAPAVQRAMRAHPEAQDAALVPFAVEENVWQSIRDLFKRSAATREMVAQGKVTVVGAVYDLPTGEVKWLDPAKPAALLAAAEKDPKRSKNAMAGESAPHAEVAPVVAAPDAAVHGDAHEAPAAPAGPKPPAAPRPEIPVGLQGAPVDKHEEEH